MNEVSKLMAHLTAKHKKEELKSEKIELSLMSDLDQILLKSEKQAQDLKQKSNQADYQSKQANNLLDEYNTFARALKDSRNDIEKGLNILENLSKSIKKLGDKIENAYKELGEQVPPKVSKSLEAAEQNYKEARSRYSNLPNLPVI